VEVGSAGTIQVPEAPGIGFQPDRQRIEELTVRQELWKRDRSAVTVPEPARSASA
jgi:hypothetical protein